MQFWPWSVYNSIQAEGYAIKACTVENLDRNYKNRNIYILSDGQVAIKALDTHQITSKLVWDCYQSLTQLARHKSVQLIWVQGHEDTAGNEIADQLARTGSEQPFIGHEPACSISIGVAKKAVRACIHSLLCRTNSQLTTGNSHAAGHFTPASQSSLHTLTFK